MSSDPMLRINMGGTFSNIQLVNSPGRAVAIGGSSLVVDSVTVNNGELLPWSDTAQGISDIQAPSSCW